MNDHALATWAEAEQMIPDAPVTASRSVTIDAPVEQVWRILTNVQAWPQWHPYLKNAELDGDFAAGSALSYGGPLKHRLTVGKVKRHELVMIYGFLARYSAVTRWDVEKADAGGTKVTFSESSAGPLISLFYGSRSLGGHLERWLIALKSAAEQGTGS
jgi:uncharacterized protein YndB with AHSA1/START domain